jgi:hypothetical protein
MRAQRGRAMSLMARIKQVAADHIPVKGLSITITLNAKDSAIAAAVAASAKPALITGLPGAGKSRVSDALQEHDIYVVELDKLGKAVVKGGETKWFIKLSPDFRASVVSGIADNISDVVRYYNINTIMYLVPSFEAWRAAMIKRAKGGGPFASSWAAFSRLHPPEFGTKVVTHINGFIALLREMEGDRELHVMGVPFDYHLAKGVADGYYTK